MGVLAADEFQTTGAKGATGRRRYPRSSKHGKKLDLEDAPPKAEYPEAERVVWAMDEHRLGLRPVQRDVWAQQG